MLVRATLRRDKALKLPLPPSPGRPYSSEEKARMLEEAQKLRTPQMHAALALDLNTGLRDKELREIRWEQIDLIHKRALTVGKSKTEAGIPHFLLSWTARAGRSGNRPRVVTCSVMMRFALYEKIEMNTTTKTGMENLTPLKERIEDYHVHWVIDEAPDETSPDEAKQRFQAAGHPLADNLEVTAETEWPEKIRQHVSSPSFNAKISLRSWGNLKPVA